MVKPLVIPLVKFISIKSLFYNYIITIKSLFLSGKVLYAVERRGGVWQGKDILQSIYFVVYMRYISRIIKRLTKRKTSFYSTVLQNVRQNVKESISSLFVGYLISLVYHLYIRIKVCSGIVGHGGLWKGTVRYAVARSGIVGFGKVKSLFYNYIITIRFLRLGSVRWCRVRSGTIGFGKDLFLRFYELYMICIRFIRLGCLGQG
ncbi:unnamed protein product, partial [marine sediment metagenome]